MKNQRIVLMVCLICLAFVSVASADVLDMLKISKNQDVTLLSDDSLSVTGTNVAYSGTFNVTNQAHSVEYKLAGTTVAVKVELEQGNQHPATPGAADASWSVPVDALELDASVADTNTYIKAYPPAATQMARFKFTGLAGNGTNTKVTSLKVARQK